jgi:hypothetical protein
MENVFQKEKREREKKKKEILNRFSIHFDSVLFAHFNTEQCLHTIANIRYGESGEVPSLESVVWRHGCISYDERI